MSSDPTVHHDDITAPVAGSVAAIDTSSTQVSTNLSSLGSGADPSALRGCYVSMRAETSDVYYVMSATASTAAAPTGAAITIASRTGATQCYVLPAGQETSFRLRSGKPFLHAIGSAAGVLRVAVTSRTPRVY